MAERNTPWRDGALPALPVAATTKIEAGKMVGINASGYAIEGANAASVKILGVADHTVDNSTGANGDQRVRVRCGKHFLLKNSATNAVDVNDAGTYVFVEDDETVADAAGTYGTIAGRCIEVVADGVWVEIPTVPQVAAQANSEASTVAAAVIDFNALLAKLRAAGIMASA